MCIGTCHVDDYVLHACVNSLPTDQPLKYEDSSRLTLAEHSHMLQCGPVPAPEWRVGPHTALMIPGMAWHGTR